MQNTTKAKPFIIYLNDIQSHLAPEIRKYLDKLQKHNFHPAFINNLANRFKSPPGDEWEIFPHELI